jgi:hypothetical protein
LAARRLLRFLFLLFCPFVPQIDDGTVGEDRQGSQEQDVQDSQTGGGKVFPEYAVCMGEETAYLAGKYRSSFVTFINALQS